MRGNTGEDKRLSDLEKSLLKRVDQETSQNLPKNLCLELYALLKKVTKEEVTPATVSAACNCSSEIHKLLKLNHQMMG